jgi:hypothetical protein
MLSARARFKFFESDRSLLSASGYARSPTESLSWISRVYEAKCIATDSDHIVHERPQKLRDKAKRLLADSDVLARYSAQLPAARAEP